MAQATDPGLAAVESYLTAANRLERRALIEERSHRPLTARLLRYQARIARRAATAERTNPKDSTP